MTRSQERLPGCSVLDLSADNQRAASSLAAGIWEGLRKAMKRRVGDALSPGRQGNFKRGPDGW